MISGMVTFPISLVVLLLVSACEAIPAIKSDVNQNERHNIAKRSTYADYYEAVIPDILIDDWTGSVYKVKFTLDAQSILYKVKMKRNRDLIRPGAEILRKQATQDTTEYLPYNNHMHFTGTVEKKDTNGTLIATGQAAFLQKNGFYGSMFVDGEEIKVEPTIRSNTSTLNDEHIVFPAVEVEDDLSHDMVAIEAVDTVSQARKKRTPPDTQYVELLATIDYDVWSEFGDAAIDHVLMRINMAQALFQHSSLVSNGFNIYFIVVKIVTIENNQIMVSINTVFWGINISETGREYYIAFITYNESCSFLYFY
uniref:Uncharacterized protein LOC102803169 n=1 Tax=Saccoglossus kowalevskii TaxID=10224 RepID=A0ABM0LWN7_SACKO|nr:PREDICTED: uncharacterized protein LOC102803169 [Saccoglossus kowalevskii]